MKRLLVLMSAFTFLSLAALSAPIKGLVDIATGREVPDADLRYLRAGVTNSSGYFTNLNATNLYVQTGNFTNLYVQTGYFTNLNATNLYVQTDATGGMDVVNYRTMTNYTVTSVISTNTSITFAGANPTNYFELYSGWNQPSFDVVRGRLWPTNGANAPLDNTMELTFWSTSVSNAVEDYIWRARLKIFLSTLTVAVTTDTNILTMASVSGLQQDYLMQVFNANRLTNVFVRISSVDTVNNKITLEQTFTNRMGTGDYVAYVPEFGGFTLEKASSNGNVGVMMLQTAAEAMKLRLEVNTRR